MFSFSCDLVRGKWYHGEFGRLWRHTAAPTDIASVKWAQLATNWSACCCSCCCFCRLVAAQAPAGGNKLNRSTALKCVAPIDSGFACHSPTHHNNNNSNNNYHNNNNNSSNNQQTGAKIDYAQFANSTLELKTSSCYMIQDLWQRSDYNDFDIFLIKLSHKAMPDCCGHIHKYICVYIDANIICDEIYDTEWVRYSFMAHLYHKHHISIMYMKKQTSLTRMWFVYWLILY